MAVAVAVVAAAAEAVAVVVVVVVVVAVVVTLPHKGGKKILSALCHLRISTRKISLR